MSSRNKHSYLEHEERTKRQAVALKAQLDSEKEQAAAWASLTRDEQIAALNAVNSRRRRRERTAKRMTTCQLPGCEYPVVTLYGRSLGICYRHGVDIAIYFDIVGEDVKQKLDRVDRIEKEVKRARLEEARAEARRNTPGFVYYILIADRIKIGYTTDVKRRLRQYPPDSPLLALHPGTRETEGDMHFRFAGSKAAGREWFLDTPELRDHIKDVIEQYGEPDRARYEHRGQHKNRNLRAS